MPDTARASLMTAACPATPGFTAPGVAGQAAVISEALAGSRIDPASVGYLEAHGTGTGLGDPVEIQAVTRAFREFTDRRGFCALGSGERHLRPPGLGAGAGPHPQ